MNDEEEHLDKPYDGRLMRPHFMDRIVGPDGRVQNCTVTSSSGSSALDNSTCRIMRSRARFTPARDQNNQPTTDTVNARITWRIAE